MPAEVRNPAGHWVRFGTDLKPAITGDNIETTGTGTFGSITANGDIILKNGEVISNATNNLIELKSQDIRFSNASGGVWISFKSDTVSGLIAMAALTGDNFLSTIPQAGKDYYLFHNSIDGRNKNFRVYGFPTGLSNQYGQFKMVSLGGANAFQISSDSGEISFADENLTTTGELDLTGGASLLPIKSTTGDPAGVEGKIYVNTFDNKIRVYADAAWRDLATW